MVNMELNGWIKLNTIPKHLEKLRDCMYQQLTDNQFPNVDGVLLRKESSIIINSQWKAMLSVYVGLPEQDFYVLDAEIPFLAVRDTIINELMGTVGGNT